MACCIFRICSHQGHGTPTSPRWHSTHSSPVGLGSKLVFRNAMLIQLPQCNLGAAAIIPIAYLRTTLSIIVVSKDAHDFRTLIFSGCLKNTCVNAIMISMILVERLFRGDLQCLALDPNSPSSHDHGPFLGHPYQSNVIQRCVDKISNVHAGQVCSWIRVTFHVLTLWRDSVIDYTYLRLFKHIYARQSGPHMWDLNCEIDQRKLGSNLPSYG